MERDRGRQTGRERENMEKVCRGREDRRWSVYVSTCRKKRKRQKVGGKWKPSVVWV